MWTSVLPALSEAFMILSAICIGTGWYFIRHKNKEIHRRFMLTGSVLGALFFISYAVRTVAVGDTSFGGPAAWKFPYLVFLQTHASLATIAGLLGIITLRYAFRERFGSHKKVAPWTASLWLIAAGSGLVVYLLLYYIYPPGPTQNVFRLITGG